MDVGRSLFTFLFFYFGFLGIFFVGFGEYVYDWRVLLLEFFVYGYRCV